MAIMPTDPNDSNYACEMAAYLRERYYGLVGGTGAKVVRYRGPNGEREVQCTSANLPALQAELTKWEALCSAVPGQPLRTRRFAIRAGSLRTNNGGEVI